MSGIFDQYRKAGFLKYSMCALTRKQYKVTPAANASGLRTQPGAAAATTTAYQSRAMSGARGIKFY